MQHRTIEDSMWRSNPINSPYKSTFDFFAQSLEYRCVLCVSLCLLFLFPFSPRVVASCSSVLWVFIRSPNDGLAQKVRRWAEGSGASYHAKLTPTVVAGH